MFVKKYDAPFNAFNLSIGEYTKVKHKKHTHSIKVCCRSIILCFLMLSIHKIPYDQYLDLNDTSLAGHYKTFMLLQS